MRGISNEEYMNTIPEPTNRTEVYLYNIYKLLLQMIGNNKQEVKQEVKQEELKQEVKKVTRKKKSETVE